MSKKSEQSHVLSASEIDSLLAAVSEGDSVIEPVLTKRNESSGSVMSYDLTSQDRIIRGRLPQLDVIYERFMRTFKVSLSRSLQMIVGMNHSSTDFLKYGEFINTLPMPTAMSVIEFNSLGGRALIVMEAKLVNGFVEAYMGGHESSSRETFRDYSKIDLSIINKIVGMVVSDLDAAFSKVHLCDLQFNRTETNPQFVSIVPPTEVSISSCFDVEVENCAGTIQILIPYSTIEPIKEKLSSGFQTEVAAGNAKNEYRSRITSNLANSSIELVANFRKTSVPLSSLSKLAIGDILSLGHPTDQAIEFSAGTNLLFLTERAGSAHGKETVKVIKKITKE
jgi:flagellar motor switch protein FliM